MRNAPAPNRSVPGATVEYGLIRATYELIIGRDIEGAWPRGTRLAGGRPHWKLDLLNVDLRLAGFVGVVGIHLPRRGRKMCKMCNEGKLQDHNSSIYGSRRDFLKSSTTVAEAAGI